MEIRKLQDAGFEQPDNRFLLRLSDYLHKREENKITNKLTNSKYSRENLPQGPSILKIGFSEILLLIQRAYILINDDGRVPCTDQLSNLINTYQNKSEYKYTDGHIIILHE